MAAIDRRAPQRADRPTNPFSQPTAPSPASVWLCAPDPTQEDPLWPVWATRTVEAFSAPGERVVIRSLGGYPALPGEMAALIGAAARTGRRPVGLLPTPAGAARTRAHLPATTPAASADTVPLRVAPAAATVSVGVGRRRPARETGPAALVVVLAGPVQPGARAPRRSPIPARVLASWAVPLRPGGVMALLSPPALGRRDRGGASGLVQAAQDAGLTYTQHIVLVHTPVVGDQLLPPASTRRPHAPFWPVHTDLHLFSAPADPLQEQL